MKFFFAYVKSLISTHVYGAFKAIIFGMVKCIIVCAGIGSTV